MEVASDRVVTRRVVDPMPPGADEVGQPTPRETATQTVVWAAGVQGDPAVGRWGLPVGPDGRVPVERTLQVPGYPEVFVVGDLAYMEAGGKALPQVAQVALQQGTRAAQNVVRMIREEPPEEPERELELRPPGFIVKAFAVESRTT